MEEVLRDNLLFVKQLMQYNNISSFVKFGSDKLLLNVNGQIIEYDLNKIKLRDLLSNKVISNLASLSIYDLYKIIEVEQKRDEIIPLKKENDGNNSKSILEEKYSELIEKNGDDPIIHRLESLIDDIIVYQDFLSEEFLLFFERFKAYMRTLKSGLMTYEQSEAIRRIDTILTNEKKKELTKTSEEELQNQNEKIFNLARVRKLTDISGFTLINLIFALDFILTLFMTIVFVAHS